MGGHAWSVADPAEGFCTSFEKQLEINAVKTGPGGHTTVNVKPLITRLSGLKRAVSRSPSLARAFALTAAQKVRSLRLRYPTLLQTMAFPLGRLVRKCWLGFAWCAVERSTVRHAL